MTKKWDQYEAVIKDLYAQHTLKVTREIMSDQYGFKASTRAYRGRLVRWRVFKYNCKRRQKRAPSQDSYSSSGVSYSSMSSPTSPAMARQPVATPSVTASDSLYVHSGSLAGQQNDLMEPREGATDRSTDFVRSPDLAYQASDLSTQSLYTYPHSTRTASVDHHGSMAPSTSYFGMGAATLPSQNHMFGYAPPIQQYTRGSIEEWRSHTQQEEPEQQQQHQQQHHHHHHHHQNYPPDQYYAAGSTDPYYYEYHLPVRGRHGTTGSAAAAQGSKTEYDRHVGNTVPHDDEHEPKYEDINEG